MVVARIDPETGKIVVSGRAAETRYISRIPGAKIQKDGAWRLPLTLDSCEELKAQKIALSTELEAVSERLRRIQRYIDQVKLKQEVAPLQPIPIKAPYHLYQHQVKAFNIALALFGRGKRKE